MGGKKEAGFRAKEGGGSKKVGFPTPDSVKNCDLSPKQVNHIAHLHTPTCKAAHLHC